MRPSTHPIKKLTYCVAETISTVSLEIATAVGEWFLNLNFVVVRFDRNNRRNVFL